MKPAKYIVVKQGWLGIDIDLYPDKKTLLKKLTRYDTNEVRIYKAKDNQIVRCDKRG